MSEIAIYPKEIAEAITKIMGADLYIQKRGKNVFHGYKYATVGDLLDKLQPLMAEAGLVIFQHEAATEMLDGGNVMATRYEFTLAHTSGAVWPEKPAHTGMSACRNTKGGFDDKAANKCHTAARKYFLLGLFQVPTGEDYREGAHDAEADAHGDAPAPRPQPAPRQANGNGVNAASRPPNPAEPPQVSAARDRVRELIAKINAHIKTAPSDHALDLAMEDAREELAEIEKAGPKGIEAANELRARYNQKIAELRQGQEA